MRQVRARMNGAGGAHTIHLQWRANIGVFRTRNSITWEDSREGESARRGRGIPVSPTALLPFWEEAILFKYPRARHRRIPPRAAGPFVFS